MAGYYAMYRGWMNHHALKEKTFSKRDAWCWLIENAAWMPHKKTWRNKTYQINRGEVPASLRALAEQWGWSVNKVQRFLDVLKTDTMVVTKTDTDFTVIIICNYEEYQAPLKNDSTVTDTVNSTVTDTTIIKDKKEEIIRTPLPPKGDAAPPIEQFTLLAEEDPPAPPPDRFPEFMKIYPNKKNRDRARKKWDIAITEVGPEVLIATAREYALERNADERPDRDRFTKHAATWLHNKCWNDYCTGGDDDHADDVSPVESMQRKGWRIGAKL